MCSYGFLKLSRDSSTLLCPSCPRLIQKLDCPSYIVLHAPLYKFKVVRSRYNIIGCPYAIEKYGLSKGECLFDGCVLIHWHWDNIINILILSITLLLQKKSLLLRRLLFSDLLFLPDYHISLSSGDGKWIASYHVCPPIDAHKCCLNWHDISVTVHLGRIHITEDEATRHRYIAPIDRITELCMKTVVMEHKCTGMCESLAVEALEDPCSVFEGSLWRHLPNSWSTFSFIEDLCTSRSRHTTIGIRLLHWIAWSSDTLDLKWSTDWSVLHSTHHARSCCRKRYCRHERSHNGKYKWCKNGKDFHKRK